MPTTFFITEMLMVSYDEKKDNSSKIVQNGIKEKNEQISEKTKRGLELLKRSSAKE